MLWSEPFQCSWVACLGLLSRRLMSLALIFITTRNINKDFPFRNGKSFLSDLSCRGQCSAFLVSLRCCFEDLVILFCFTIVNRIVLVYQIKSQWNTIKHDACYVTRSGKGDVSFLQMSDDASRPAAAPALCRGNITALTRHVSRVAFEM